MISIVGLFLIGMVVLALFGRIKRPGTRIGGKKCRHCGTPLIGKGPCACGKRQ
ncbi:MAG: hypothetical protein HKN63_03330 [Rhodobacteraceae bacterium]|nr:hypothetical protein [Paracoccaceae bacterium]